METKSLIPFRTGFLAVLLTISGLAHAGLETEEAAQMAAVPTIDPVYEQGVQEWSDLNAKQGQACAPEHDARQVLLGKKKVATVILLHGYSQSPMAMDDYLRYFSSLDVNILVPRLSHHFNPNIGDLDSVNYLDWLRQMRKTVAIAKKLGRRVVIVGFSLGGSLATRMALEFPGDITGLILLSPAWRVNPRISGGLLLGNATSKNGHDFLGYKPECNLKKPYLSKNGGKQVEKLASSNEDNFQGQYPHAEGSAIRKLELPMLVAMMEDDDVIDSRMARDMFTPMENGFTTLLVYPGINHSLLTTPGAANCQMYNPNLSKTPFKNFNLVGQVHEFMRVILGVRTDVLNLGTEFKM